MAHSDWGRLEDLWAAWVEDSATRSYSNTRLTTYKRCRLKYYWQYIERQGQSNATALRRGAAAHKAMAVFYEGAPVMEAIEAAWLDYGPNDPESLEQMLKLDEILSRYFSFTARNDKWKVLEVEHTVEVKYQGEKLMGIWDLLIETQGKRFIVDHKFQKSHSFANLDADPQVTHYLALAKLAGVKVDGLMYNIVNLELSKTAAPCFRQIVNRSEAFIDAYLQGLLPQIEEISELEAGNISVYPNWTRDCCWDCQWYAQCLNKPYKKLSN